MSRRTTSLKDQSAAAFGATPELQWLPVKQLSVVWKNAQRPLDERFAKTIADNFDPDMFGTIAVTLPNGEGIFHIIDGNHRRAAVLSMWGENERVPCQVFNAKDPARAAQIFDRINNQRKSITTLQSFIVRVTAGEVDEVAVNKILLANGLHPGSNPSSNGKAVAAVGALLQVYRDHDSQTLDVTLKVLMNTWRDNTALTAPLLRGYAAVLSEFRDRIDIARLQQVVSKQYSPLRLLGAAKTAREMNGGTIATNLSKLLVANYNRGARGKKLLRGKSEQEGDDEE
jgi:hypothetical protein